jgi:hypothetical protein
MITKLAELRAQAPNFDTLLSILEQSVRASLVPRFLQRERVDEDDGITRRTVNVYRQKYYRMRRLRAVVGNRG